MKVPSAIELKRDLGLWSAVAIVVGTVIGSGIFIVPQTMVKLVGSPRMVFVVWVVGGLLSLAGALSYSELAAAMPEAGGEYVYLSEGYGPLWGFIYGWTQMWVAKSGSVAILATGFFYYLANFVPELERIFFTVPLPLGAHGAPLDIRYGQLLAMALIFSLAVLNYFGVKVGGEVQVAVTILKVALILLIVIVGLGWGHPTSAPHTAVLTQVTVLGFFAALVKSLWAYDGWNNVSMVASEIRNPQRNLPLALIWGTTGVIIIYLLANAAYFYVSLARTGRRQQSRGGDDDAAGMGRRRRQSGFGGCDDLDVRCVKRFHPFGRPRALCTGAGRLLFRSHGARKCEISHAGGFDHGFERVGNGRRAFGHLRSITRLRDLRELASLRHDYRHGSRAAQEKT